MSNDLRRVVTDHDGTGLAIIRSDDRIGLMPAPGLNASGAVVWTTGRVPADNMTDVEGADRDEGMSIRGGSVFRVTDFGPGFVSPMHRTHSIDYCYVIAGEIELELDGGGCVRLAPGDIAIQRGTSQRLAKSKLRHARSAAGLHGGSRSGRCRRHAARTEPIGGMDVVNRHVEQAGCRDLRYRSSRNQRPTVALVHERIRSKGLGAFSPLLLDLALDSVRLLLKRGFEWSL